MNDRYHTILGEAAVVELILAANAAEKTTVEKEEKKKKKKKKDTNGKKYQKGVSAVHRAAGAGHANIVRALVEAGSGSGNGLTFTANGYGLDVASDDTPLHWACSGATQGD